MGRPVCVPPSADPSRFAALHLLLDWPSDPALTKRAPENAPTVQVAQIILEPAVHCRTYDPDEGNERRGRRRYRSRSAGARLLLLGRREELAGRPLRA